MASAAGTRLTPGEGRRFAWTVAGGFAVIGALLAWRRGVGAAWPPWAVAAVLLTAGLVVPTRLGPVARGWTAFGLALSRLTAPVFFAVLYWLVLTPMGLLRRRLGRSPLARRSDASSYWVRRPTVPAEERRRQMEHQF